MPRLQFPPESLHAYSEDRTHDNDFGDLIDDAVQQYSQSPRGQPEEGGDQVNLPNYS